MQSEIKEIVFSKLEIDTRVYEVIGWKRVWKKKGRPTIDKNFIELKNIPKGDPLIHHGTNIVIPYPIRLHSSTHYKEIP